MRSPLAFRRLIATNIGLVITCAAIAGWATFTNGRRAGISDAIVISAGEQDFGEVWESEAFPWHVSVTNRSGSDLDIAKFETSCGCVSITPTQMTVNAGESRDVSMVLDLTRGHKPEDQLEPREFSLAVTPIVSNGYPQKSWLIRGRVRPLFGLSAEAVGWNNGDEIIQGGAPRPRVVNVITPPRVTLQTAAVDTIVERVETEQEGEEDHYRLSIYPSSGLPLGEFSSNVKLLAYDETGKLVGESRLAVFGEVVGNVEATPRSLELGMRRVGEVAISQVTLKSRTTAPFKITDVQPEGVEILEPLDQSKWQDRCDVQVAQRVQRQGDAASRIRFAIETDMGRETLEVRIRYRGISKRVEE